MSATNNEENAGRKLIGYRVRGTHETATFYANSDRDCWDRTVSPPISKRGARHLLSDTGGFSTDENGEPIEVSSVKIVAVYLRTATKGPIDRTLSDFNREVVAEIDRRGIDAFAEPEDFGAMPTTLRFRTPNGGFVWVPIIAFSVVEGPKEERAKRTVDRMLEAIAHLASRLVVVGQR